MYPKKITMKMQRTWLAGLALLIGTFVWFGYAQPFSPAKAEKEAVKAAVLDYVEGLYEVAPDRIERSVHKDLKKVGFWYNPNQEAFGDLSPMTYDQLHTLASRWNANGQQATDDSPKKIEIYDVLGRTANAKLTAEWGTDYMQLAKIDGKWMIMHVLWQSPDPS